MHEVFVNAIRSMNMVRLTFYSKEDGGVLVRACAPMDYGPSRRARDKSPRYHFWDFESDTRNHVLSLLPNQIVGIEALSDVFRPADFVTWDVVSSPWFVDRDWGPFS